MNFRYLETFHWINRLGSFASAADKLHMTQSAMSARIKELEQSLGVSLFDRKVGGVALTVAGRTLVPLAEEALAISESIRTRVGSKTQLSGLVRIGVGEIIAMSWLPEMLARMSSAYPAIEAELVVDLTVKLNQMVADGKLDIALGVDPGPPTLIEQSLGNAAIRWMASPSRGLRHCTDVRQLSKQPVFTLSRESHMHGHILSWFAAHDLRPKLIHGCNSVNTVIGLVRGGCGVAPLPVILVEKEIASGQLEILEFAPPVDHYEFFVVRERSMIDPTILVMVQLAVETSTFERSQKWGALAQN
ncbi:LysR family transcriptional regulator [Paraburkholderia caffeinilytica]|uniref:LysR family transcriptional regulator n=1 Tax=Paraburkholderia caffeinilytica TaxID=1761016 RepID=UPI0038B711FF